MAKEGEARRPGKAWSMRRKRGLEGEVEPTNPEGDFVQVEAAGTAWGRVERHEPGEGTLEVLGV